MSNVLKFCGCPACRAGMHRHRYPGGNARVRRVARRFRRLTKAALRMGLEPPKAMSVPYTD